MYYTNIHGTQGYYDGAGPDVTETKNGFYFAEHTDRAKVTNDITNNGQYYPVWANGTQGYVDFKTSSPKLLFNPSTGNLYSTKYTVDSSVTLQYNTTLKSLDFIFN